MQIGYMKKLEKPNKNFKLLAKACKYYDIDLVYFNKHSIDLETEKITGKILVNNKWKDMEIKELPPYIDIMPNFFRSEHLIDFLKERTQLSIEKSPGTKLEVFGKIEEEGSYSHLLIPYLIYTEFKDVTRFIKQHNHIILKPIKGFQGKQVYKVTKKGRKFIVDYLNKSQKFNKKQFKTFLKNNIKENQTLIQKYIKSRSKKDEPFDCRIRLEKNGKGKWQTAITLVRIGSNNKVVSNVKRGGSVSKLPPFLKANFDDKAEKVETELKKIAKNFPPKLEEILDQRLVSLGLDMGIDHEGNPYIFEVETAPGYEFGAGEVVSLKTDYYNYVIENVLSDQK